MLDDYQDRLDYLYGRLNYESVGMPRARPSSGSAGCAGSSGGWAIPTSGSA